MESVMCECLPASGRALVTATMVWSAKNRACKRVPDSPHPPLLKRLFWPLSKGFCPITMPTCLMEWGTSGQMEGESISTLRWISFVKRYVSDEILLYHITLSRIRMQNAHGALFYARSARAWQSQTFLQSSGHMQYNKLPSFTMLLSTKMACRHTIYIAW